jgi:hypothetical protein
MEVTVSAKADEGHALIMAVLESGCEGSVKQMVQLYRRNALRTSVHILGFLKEED